MEPSTNENGSKSKPRTLDTDFLRQYMATMAKPTNTSDKVNSAPPKSFGSSISILKKNNFNTKPESRESAAKKPKLNSSVSLESSSYGQDSPSPSSNDTYPSDEEDNKKTPSELPLKMPVKSLNPSVQTLLSSLPGVSLNISNGSSNSEPKSSSNLSSKSPVSLKVNNFLPKNNSNLLNTLASSISIKNHNSENSKMPVLPSSISIKSNTTISGSNNVIHSTNKPKDAEKPSVDKVVNVSKDLSNPVAAKTSLQKELGSKTVNSEIETSVSPTKPVNKKLLNSLKGISINHVTKKVIDRVEPVEPVDSPASSFSSGSRQPSPAPELRSRDGTPLSDNLLPGTPSSETSLNLMSLGSDHTPENPEEDEEELPKADAAEEEAQLEKEETEEEREAHCRRSSRDRRAKKFACYFENSSDTSEYDSMVAFKGKSKTLKPTEDKVKSKEEEKDAEKGSLSGDELPDSILDEDVDGEKSGRVNSDKEEDSKPQSGIRLNRNNSIAIEESVVSKPVSSSGPEKVDLKDNSEVSAETIKSLRSSTDICPQETNEDKNLVKWDPTAKIENDSKESEIKPKTACSNTESLFISKQKIEQRLANDEKDKKINFSDLLKTLEAEDPLLNSQKAQLVKVSQTDSLLPQSQSLTVLDSPSKGGVCKKSTGALTAKANRVLPSIVPGPTSMKRGISEVETDLSKSQKVTSDLKKLRLNHNMVNGVDTAEDKNDVARKLEASKTLKQHLTEDKNLTMTNERKWNSKQMDNEELQRLEASELEKISDRSKRKVQTIKRKDLENLVVKLFIDQLLYQHELGQQKDLCKRLEATLEANRKKAAVFHKEIDDLRKVTTRLKSEHDLRKSQLITPIKVKRSVGIQATPAIINKGLMCQNNASIKPTSTKDVVTATTNLPLSVISAPNSVSAVTETINVGNQMVQMREVPIAHTGFPIGASPSMQLDKKTTYVVTSGVPAIQSQGTQITTLSPGTMVPVSSVGQVQQMIMVNTPNQQTLLLQPTSAGGTTPILQGARIIRTATPIMPQNQPITVSKQVPIIQQPIRQYSPQVQKTSSITSSAGIIDLTDDDEPQRISVKPGPKSVRYAQSTQIVQKNSPTKFVTLPQSSVANLLVLAPKNSQNSSLSSPATPIVMTMSQGQSPMNRFGATVKTTPQAQRVVQNGVVSFNQPNAQNRHPAALPRAPPQQTAGISKKLPPLPILKLNHKENSIILSWNMNKTSQHEDIASYQLYAYQQGSMPPNPSLWKKVGSVKALELPMACTLTQFMPGHMYHFAVRAVDSKNRLGPFSEPQSIRLGGK